ncbi:MAG: hypothetical protein KA821_13640 [Chitinophagaceae bacterium]|nr:hypothetical protein [Chitinophagaceae bacterium]
MAKIMGSESKNILKNMVISVTTTVVGALAIYFLGFSNKSSGPSKLEMEELTIDAWKTLVTVENIYAKNGVSLLRDAKNFGSYKAVGDESQKESAKFVNSLQKLLETEGIDKDMRAMLERRIENEKVQIKATTKFFNDLDDYINRGVDNDWTEQQVTDSVLAFMVRFGKESQGIVDRSVNDIEGLAKVLSERYDHDFNVEDFLSVQIARKKLDPIAMLDDSKGTKPPDDPNSKLGGAGSGPLGSTWGNYLNGKWDASGATIQFTKDGKTSWFVPAQNTEAKGSWKIINEKLVMNMTNPQNGKNAIWEFNLSNAEEKSFSMVLTKEPYNYYKLVRKN